MKFLLNQRVLRVISLPERIALEADRIESGSDELRLADFLRTAMGWDLCDPYNLYSLKIEGHAQTFLANFRVMFLLDKLIHKQFGVEEAWPQLSHPGANANDTYLSMRLMRMGVKLNVRSLLLAPAVDQSFLQKLTRKFDPRPYVQAGTRTPSIAFRDRYTPRQNELEDCEMTEYLANFLYCAVGMAQGNNLSGPAEPERHHWRLPENLYGYGPSSIHFLMRELKHTVELLEKE